MRVSVQMIAFNCETIMPKGMLKACIDHIYPFVDQIVITEGATLARTGRFDGDPTSFTKIGKSTDNTLSILFSYPDPEKKLKIIPSMGFWNGKTEMFRAGSEHVNGDYVWQIDADEFYHERDIPKILELLHSEKPDAVHFFAHHFWGDFDHVVNEITEGKWGNDSPWMRIFKHCPGAKWISHEPPEYKLPNGKMCNQGDVLSRMHTLREGIKIFHYGHVCEGQIRFKERFYRNYEYTKAWRAWQCNHNCPIIKGCKTRKFDGDHPAIINELLKNKEYA